MKQLLWLMLPLLLGAESLKSLLEYAHEKNEHIASKSIAVEAKKSEVDSQKSAYLPTLDLGGVYQRFDDPNPFSPRATYSGFATVGVDIYSGGKKSALLGQKTKELQASRHELEATKKSLALQITQNFYNLKILQAELETRLEASNAIKAQLERTRRFYDAALATDDEVKRLQAAFEQNRYLTQSLRFEMLEIEKNLALQVGKDIEVFEESTFVKESLSEAAELESITAQRAKKAALLHAAEALESAYSPQLRLEDTFSLYGYEEIPTFPSGLALPENQNRLSAALNIRLFDFGAVAQASEALRLNANALQTEISYQNKEQQMLLSLATSRIETAKRKIESASSGLEAAASALKTITKKYENAIVDNVTYLDALTSYTQAKAAHKASLYNLEIAYAIYYYYNSKNLEEFLQ